jgi:hypothetical protein
MLSPLPGAPSMHRSTSSRCTTSLNCTPPREHRGRRGVGRSDADRPSSFALNISGREALVLARREEHHVARLSCAQRRAQLRSRLHTHLSSEHAASASANCVASIYALAAQAPAAPRTDMPALRATRRPASRLGRCARLAVP